MFLSFLWCRCRALKIVFKSLFPLNCAFICFPVEKVFSFYVAIFALVNGLNHWLQLNNLVAIKRCHRSLVNFISFFLFFICQWNSTETFQDKQRSSIRMELFKKMVKFYCIILHDASAMYLILLNVIFKFTLNKLTIKWIENTVFQIFFNCFYCLFIVYSLCVWLKPKIAASLSGDRCQMFETKRKTQLMKWIVWGVKWYCEWINASRRKKKCFRNENDNTECDSGAFWWCSRIAHKIRYLLVLVLILRPSFYFIVFVYTLTGYRTDCLSGDSFTSDTI